MELIKDIKSTINSFFTLDYMTIVEENKYFDRKSAKIKVSDLADLISAFANAEGGTIVIGISDKTKKVEGINMLDAEKINNFISAPKDCCKPMPNYKEEFLDVINVVGEKDRILLLHIFTSVDQVIRTNSDTTFLRICDRTKEIKDVNLEYPLLKIIAKAKEFVSVQLREFTALNQTTGRFQIVPEYPEFAWLEGIVNAVTHREYGMTGSYIKVSMFDDRLEILSPGKLPSIVTIDNIRDTRFSRNSRIARGLTEFGWVRELNEGVKRIYEDMEDFFLEEPMYSEPEQSVKLVLKNNIVMRTMRQSDRTIENIGNDIWDKLDDLERKILVYMGSRATVTRAELEQHISRSGRTVGARLNHLMELGLVKRNGNMYNPKQTYEIVE